MDDDKNESAKRSQSERLFLGTMLLSPGRLPLITTQNGEMTGDGSSGVSHRFSQPSRQCKWADGIQFAAAAIVAAALRRRTCCASSIFSGHDSGMQEIVPERQQLCLTHDLADLLHSY